MFKNLPKYPNLLVVSDTGMYLHKGRMYAFGPVVKELEYMLQLFESITWIGFNKNDQKHNASYIEVKSDKIKIVLLNAVGGKTFFDKMNIIMNYPKMWFVIHHELKTHQYIHSRAPSNPAVITMFLSKFYHKKIFWFKYAGVWLGKASLFYILQRKLLKMLGENCKITVNGNWNNQPKNIVAFENPCLDKNDRLLGKDIIENKNKLDQFNYCFVGNLDENKGASRVIKAFELLNHSKLGNLHIVGDGVLKKQLEKDALNIDRTIIFHGFLPKDQIHEIYTKCHFIILPSQSEGFPKVIGEAMNFGCIPIVSNVSCIGQYVQNNFNGFLIDEITVDNIKEKIEKSFLLKNSDFENYIKINYKLAKKFTYDYYLEQIYNKILKNNNN